MRHLLFLWAVAGIATVFYGCGSTDSLTPCPTEPVTAHFTIGQRAPYYENIVYGDTVVTFRGVTLEADSGYQSYEWKIGDDPDRQAIRDRKTSLSFVEPYARIEIRLIVEDNPNTRCFADDDGRDTLVRYLTVIDRHQNPIFDTRYEGFLEEKPDHLFIVEITEEGMLRNINEGCLIDYSKWGIGLAEGFLYRTVLFGRNMTDHNCQRPHGIATLAPNNVDFIVDFTTWEGGDAPRVPHRFIGKRIP